MKALRVDEVRTRRLVVEDDDGVPWLTAETIDDGAFGSRSLTIEWTGGGSINLEVDKEAAYFNVRGPVDFKVSRVPGKLSLPGWVSIEARPGVSSLGVRGGDVAAVELSGDIDRASVSVKGSGRRTVIDANGIETQDRAESSPG